MVFTIPEFGGSEAILAANAPRLKIDLTTNHADLGQPLVIRQSPPNGQGIALGLPIGNASHP
jgi:hypothetical protein